MRSILLPYLVAGQPIQIFIDKIESIHYNYVDATHQYVYIGSSGIPDAIEISVTDADDATALIAQINAAINSTAIQTTVTGSPAIPASCPLGIAATADYGQIVISWTNDTNPAYSYFVYSSLISGGPYSIAGTTTSTPFTDTGVGAAEARYYVVSTYSSAGESPQSTEYTATGLTPAAPASAAATPGYYSAVLTWAAVTGSTAFPTPTYRIYRNSVLAFDNVYDLTVTDTGLPPSVSVSYDIKAVFNGVEGTLINATATPNPFTAVASPAVTPGIYSNSVTWTAKSGATGYNIYRSESSGTETYFTSVATNSLTDTALRYDTTYFYKITPTANDGEGPQSSEVSGQPTTATFSSSTGGSVLGGTVSFYGTGFSASQGGFMRFGTVTIVDLYCTYVSSTEISISVPGGLTPGSVQFYYMVSGSSYQLPFTVAFT